MHTFLKTIVVASLGLAMLSPRAYPGRLAVFVPNGNGTGSVRSIDVDGASAPIDSIGLQGIQITEIDFCGRTQLFELDAKNPRYRDDVPSAARLELPNSRGSLYRFRRLEPSGVRTTGFFLVEPTGAARVLFERTVATPVMGDSTLSRVAVAPDGSAILVVTTLADTGDLFLVDVATGTERLLTSTLPPMEYKWNGLALRETFGAVVTDQGVLRFDRATSAPATFVPFDFGTPPDWFGDAIVSSGNGAFCAVVAGLADSEHAFPFVFGSGGPARAASTTPMHFVSAGFLPEVVNGPYLAVSEDGTRCAWRTRLVGSYQSDLVLGTVSSAANPPPAELTVTADPTFEPYLDEVALFHFRPNGRFLFGVADAQTTSGAGLVRMDLFALTTQANGTVAISNLSHSSSELVPPFNLLPAYTPDRVHWIEEAQAFVLHLPQSAGGVVQRVSETGLSSTQFHDVAEIDVFERSGGDILLSLVESNASEQEFQRVDPALASEADGVPGPENGRVRRVATGPNGELMYVFATGLHETLWVVRPPSEYPRSVDPRAFPIGPTLAFTSAGSAAFTLELGGGSALLACVSPQDSLRRVTTLPANSFVLPGR